MNGATPTTLELRDIHLPEAISWWPPAPGWWFLLGSIVFIVIAVFLFKHYQKKQALKKQVLAEFEKSHVIKLEGKSIRILQLSMIKEICQKYQIY